MKRPPPTPRSGIGQSTSTSLIERARLADADAWQRIATLYAPIVYRWLRLAGLQPMDAADAAQEVFTSLAQRLSAFRRDRAGDSFRGWLWTITRNKLRDHFRRLQRQPPGPGGSNAYEQLQQVPDAILESEPERQSERAGILRRALDLIRMEFEERTWQAFWRVAVEGQGPADVAEDLGLSVASVYQAKCRVMRRLRLELDEVWE